MCTNRGCKGTNDIYGEAPNDILLHEFAGGEYMLHELCSAMLCVSNKMILPIHLASDLLGIDLDGVMTFWMLIENYSHFLFYRANSIDEFWLEDLLVQIMEFGIDFSIGNVHCE